MSTGSKGRTVPPEADGSVPPEKDGDKTSAAIEDSGGSDERQMAEALRRSEERLRLAMAAGSIGVWDWDIPTGRVKWSDRLDQSLGLEAGAFSESIDHFHTLVHPEDQLKVSAALEEAFNGEADYRIEFRILNSEGCIRWSDARAVVLRDESGRPLRMIGIDMDITARKASEERQQQLTRELDHRVKNILSVVQAVALQTFGSSSERAAFFGRLSALARAHGLLTTNSGGAVDLTELAAKELAAYPANRIEITGSSVFLSSTAAQTFALVLHELTTNAAKYGALSGKKGRVSVEWFLTAGDEPILEFNWTEQDGPPVEPPTRVGFGTELIKNSITFELDGKTELQFLYQGLRVQSHVPLRSLRNQA